MKIRTTNEHLLRVICIFITYNLYFIQSEIRDSTTVPPDQTLFFFKTNFNKNQSTFCRIWSKMSLVWKYKRPHKRMIYNAHVHWTMKILCICPSLSRCLQIHFKAHLSRSLEEISILFLQGAFYLARDYHLREIFSLLVYNTILSL